MSKPLAFAVLACLFAAAPALAQSEWAAPQLKEMDAVFGQPVDGLTSRAPRPPAWSAW